MMDINSSGTGGAEDNIIKDMNDESEVADDNNLTQNLLRGDDGSSQPMPRKGSKIGGTTGQVATKEIGSNDDTTENNFGSGGTTADGRPSSKRYFKKR